MEKKIRKTRDQRLAISLEMAKRNLHRRPNSVWIKRIDAQRKVWLRKTADLLPSRLVSFLYGEVLYRLSKRNFSYNAAIHYINEYTRHMSAADWQILNASRFDRKLAKAMYRAIWLEAKSLYNCNLQEEDLLEVCAISNDNSLWVADRFK